MPWPGLPFEEGPPGREGGARLEKGGKPATVATAPQEEDRAPKRGSFTRGGGFRRRDASERISDREVQDHIADISSAFKVPLGT